MLSENNIIKISDFGTSSFIWSGEENEMKMGVQIGTPHWSAPETFTEKLSPSGWRKADIWSVGCTIIEMMTGNHPWPEYEDSSIALLNIPLQKNGPPHPAVSSKELKQFLDKCFKIDPKERSEVK